MRLGGLTGRFIQRTPSVIEPRITIKPPQFAALIRHLHRLAGPQPSDAELLGRWVRQRDEDAFAALVARHGPMVLGVCQRVLGQPQDAEDAFQATFLILARKAASLRRPEVLAGWLHGVAVRLARKARTAGARRRKTDSCTLTPWNRPTANRTRWTF